MKGKISVLMITKNAQELLVKSLRSVAGLANEIVVVDDYSTDETVKIAKRFKARIIQNHEEDFGKQRKFSLKQATNSWILVLDSDEIVPICLKKEIKKVVSESKFNGYYIPFNNHFLGKKLRYGGEDYKKLILFKKDKVTITPALVHEKFVIKSGKVGYLKNKVYHYSYRSLLKMYQKFTDYAVREARQKVKNGEKTSLKKIFFYAPHMLWARFIKDRGYKDGFFRLPLDIGFAGMEFLTYFLMLFIKQ